MAWTDPDSFFDIDLELSMDDELVDQTEFMLDRMVCLVEAAGSLSTLLEWGILDRVVPEGTIDTLSMLVPASRGGQARGLAAELMWQRHVERVEQRWGRDRILELRRVWQDGIRKAEERMATEHKAQVEQGAETETEQA